MVSGLMVSRINVDAKHMKHFVRTMFKRTSFALLVALGPGGASTSHAQILSHGDLFGPGAPPPMVGIELGVGKHTQQGTYLAACGCTFQNGSGAGFMGNLVFELPLDYD